jgi:DNA-directed RNA polymerase specialized sigma24 family protein
MVQLIDPDASLDLGWLILNRQVDDETLGGLLLAVYQARLARLAAAFLPSPADVLAAVDATVAWVLLNRRAYHSTESGRAWLYARALQEFTSPSAPADRVSRRLSPQALIDAFDPAAGAPPHFADLLQSLGKEPALLLVLHYAHDLSVEEISAALGLPLEQVQAGFAQVKDRLIEHQRGCAICASPSGDLTGVERLLAKSFANSGAVAAPRFDFGQNDLLAWNASILKRVTVQRRSQQTRARHRQSLQGGLLLALLLLFAGLSTVLNSRVRKLAAPARSAQARLTPKVPPAPPLQQTLSAAIAFQSARPGDPQPQPPEPTSTASERLPDPQAILRSANDSPGAWQTLWADVQITRYQLVGGDSFSGMVLGSVPDHTIRKQIWALQPSLSRVISGPSSGLPNQTTVVTGGNISGINFTTGQAVADYTSQLIADPDLAALFVPQYMFLSGGFFTTVGREDVAGRAAWVLDWSTASSPVYRFWIDAERGVLLRRRVYTDHNLKSIFVDIRVDAIYFDIPLSPTLFEPSQYRGDRFAVDFSGMPEISDVQFAQGAVHSLTGSYFNQLLPGPHLEAGPATTAQAAPGLAAPVFTQTPPLFCDWSLDGRQVAYTSMIRSAQGDSSLAVLTLSPRTPARPVLPAGKTAGDYAFSPNGRRLAFFGCDPGSGFCGLFLFDTVTGQTTRLAPLNYADYIIWKPDGSALALVAEDKDAGLIARKATTNMLEKEVNALLQNWHFLVIDAATGQVTYKRPFDWSTLAAPPGSPTTAWGKPFKSNLPGLDSCVSPVESAGR